MVFCRIYRSFGSAKGRGELKTESLHGGNINWASTVPINLRPQKEETIIERRARGIRHRLTYSALEHEYGRHYMSRLLQYFPKSTPLGQEQIGLVLARLEL